QARSRGCRHDSDCGDCQRCVKKHCKDAPDGQTCGRNEACRTGRCQASCGTVGGGACCPDTTCGGGLRCLCDRGAVCHQPGCVGSGCDCDEFCNVGLHCDFTTHTCQPGPGDGTSSCCAPPPPPPACG